MYFCWFTFKEKGRPELVPNSYAHWTFGWQFQKFCSMMVPVFIELWIWQLLLHEEYIYYAVSIIVCLYFLSFVLWCPLRFPHKSDVRFILPPCLIYVSCVCFCIVMSNTYCVVFFFVLCALCCCQFLSALSIFDCTFRIL